MKEFLGDAWVVFSIFFLWGGVLLGKDLGCFFWLSFLECSQSVCCSPQKLGNERALRERTSTTAIYLHEGSQARQHFEKKILRVCEHKFGKTMFKLRDKVFKAEKFCISRELYSKIKERYWRWILNALKGGGEEAWEVFGSYFEVKNIIDWF